MNLRDLDCTDEERAAISKAASVLGDHVIACSVCRPASRFGQLCAEGQRLSRVVLPGRVPDTVTVTLGGEGE